MPVRRGAPLGAPIWIDLTTSDPDRAQEFYGAVFGWTFASAGPDLGGYVDVAKDGHRVAGLMQDGRQLDDLSEHRRRRQDTGGDHRPRRQCGAGCRRHPYGRLAAAADPTGALFNLSSLAAA
jgi:uncharacterized protein